jgi:branched-chain amino acid transport system permease protein
MRYEAVTLHAGTRSNNVPRKRWFWLGIAVLIISALLVPWIGSRYHVSFVFFFCLALTLTATYEIIGGYMGYINMGHGAFFGLGVYVYGITITQGGSLPLGLVLAVVITAVFAGLIAIPIFRLRGAYFAIGTFGILMVMWVLATNLRDLTGGTTGLSISPTASTIPSYYLMLVTAVMAMALNAWIACSRLGLGLLSIREDEEVAQVSGINTMRFKQGMMVLSSLLPGFAGGVYMWQMTYADPNSTFGPEITFAPIIMAMLGGSGTVAGAFVGTTFVILIEELLWSRLGYLHLAMYGVVLVFVGLFMPGGLMRSPLFIKLYRALGLPDHYGYRVWGRAQIKQIDRRAG